MSGQDGRDDSGLSCNLAALDKAQRTRWELLVQWLQAGTVDVVEVADGYALHLDRESLAAEHVDEFVALESRCCPFLRLGVRPASGGGGPVLEVGGGEKIKSFVAAQFRIRGAGDHAG